MRRRKAYTDDDLRQAVAESLSFAQVLVRLGLRPAGGNYRALKALLLTLQIDYSHFTHSAWSRGKKMGHKRELQAYLGNPPLFKLGTHHLKLRLIGAGVFKPECSSCHNQTWMGQGIPLELDHINGVASDNRLENLRLLCPNCHALTSTYRGKNKKL